ncbi:MAG: insulinase family protein [candidate division Zixibacteria bacterium]
MRAFYIPLLAILIGSGIAAPAEGKIVFEKLKKDQRIADFRTEYIYDNEMGMAMGARFRHIPSGFVLDLLRIQSVPQAFIWVNSPPPTDQGEPHTCEHLLLGKGTKGRYVASLEDMSLGSSSAFTMQLQTCYHFHTAAGTDIFFDLFEAKLDAFIHPNFSDEEIRREVANIGYSIDPIDSTLRLEEKGTVYNEMVRAFESPWSNLSRRLGHLLYGPEHPISYSSGGYPDAIRTMTPDEMWTFIENTYHLNNMGMIAAIPDEISIEDFLKRSSAIFKRVEPDAKANNDPATLDDRLPPPKTAAPGAIEQSYFPAENENEPGLILYAWPPNRNLNPNEELLLELFMGNLAGGETSNLYGKFIDSDTRIMDIGSNSVFGWLDTDPGQPVYVGFSNVKLEATEIEMIDSIRAIVLNEIKAISKYDDGSPELTDFNERAKNRIIAQRRDLRKFLNTPPRFGYRGTGSRWYYHLKHLQKTDNFRKKLTLDSEMDFAEKTLNSDKNIWGEYLNKWGLLDAKPFGVGARANPEMLERSEGERKDRIAKFISERKEEYAIDDENKVLEKFKTEYDANTAAIEDEAKKIAMPKFVDNPPLTLDDQLSYSIEELPGGGELIVSTFDNMTSATAGLAFDLYAVPESDLLYLSALPVLMTDVGVIKNGEKLAYDEMIERIRKEILGLNTYFSVNNRTERAEVVIRGAGSDSDEAILAIDWMATVLFDTDWSVENLPRIRDAVDLYLKSLRNTMKGSEESWVNDPAGAYWKQNNPLLLSANSFMTKIHHLHRLRWMLKETDSSTARSEFAEFIGLIAGFADKANREQMENLLAALTGKVDTGESEYEIIDRLMTFSGDAKILARDAADDLRITLADIPDNSLTDDWQYLCAQIYSDLQVKPEQALSDLNKVISLLRKSDNVRGFLIANTENQKSLIPRLNSLVERFDTSPTERQAYNSNQSIISRAKSRTPGLDRPVYVGLINQNTRSGVFINTSNCASYETTDKETLLKFLSARLYGGGGAHSMFMKTWGAGLAYSNGLRSNESSGRIIYYAERCPDLAQTMQFVVEQLNNSDRDPSLAEYAVAQAFVGNRAGSRYESRGEAMAADLADGVTPEVVTRFRETILELREDKKLAEKLYSRMEDTYGEVLPGYGPYGKDVSGAIYFIIGPESQFQLFENYLRGVESDETLYRLYPRDFWITEDKQPGF